MKRKLLVIGALMALLSVAQAGAAVTQNDLTLDRLGVQGGDVVRLTLSTWDGMPQVITLKLDLRYWPTAEVAYGADGWTRRSIH